ncbi:hypothetical protein [Nonomuraea sp. NPDC049607]|uniref:hypothetical protein n=1 Tax=Nonomuraea sp. NPDC049607 TaxID=3154732 RepID=UPI003441270C
MDAPAVTDSPDRSERLVISVRQPCVPASSGRTWAASRASSSTTRSAWSWPSG